jgi:hypothetical protein
MLSLILFMALLAVVGILALRFGADSRREGFTL